MHERKPERAPRRAPPPHPQADRRGDDPDAAHPHAAAPAGASTLLIVSDLHLGAALRPPMGYAALRMTARLDRALERFLEYHLARPARDEEGAPRPWTLIFNGDTIDFLHMGLSAEDQVTLEGEEALYGLSFARRRSRWKLQEIARYHRRAFRALCRFIEQGHQCVFVIGNHDADLWFEQVRRDLTAAVARHARQPKAVKRMIHFAPWFYYEEGRVYIEHGHRFDPYSTFPDPLAPLNREESALEPTFGHWGLRYFCNPVPTFPLHDLERWGPVDFIRWALNRAGVGLSSLVLFYLRFLWRYARDTAAARLAVQREALAGRQRGRRLARFARRARLSMRRVRALDALRLQHVGASWLRIAQAIYVDRAVLVLLSGVGMLWWARVAEGWALAAGLAAGALGVGVAWVTLAQLRPPQDTHPLLGDIAQQIGDITGVPLVVFGHTHHPTLTERDGVRWLNPGSWEHLPRSESHAPDQPCTCGAKFGVVRGEGAEMRVGLYQWCEVRRAAELVRDEREGDGREGDGRAQGAQRAAGSAEVVAVAGGAPAGASSTHSE